VIGGAHTRYIGKFHPDFIWKGHPEHGKRTNPTIDEHLRRAALAAIADARVDPSDIERGFVGNFAGECFARQGHLGAVLAGADPGLARKPHARIEGACASGGLALAAGVDAVAAGSDLVLVVGVEVQSTVSAREGADFLARAAWYRDQRAIDPFPFPCLFARRARAYREAYGVSPADIAAPVVKAHRNAAKNPDAHLHAIGDRMTIERACPCPENPFFLENPEYREFLTIADCSPVSDGASALVLASAQGLAKLGRPAGEAVEIAGIGIAVDALEASAGPDFDLLRLSTTEAAAAEAFGSAGVRPGEIEVAEVHDCFGIAEILHMEALGFAAPGRGAALIASSETAAGGRLPVNPGGGLIGFGHPVGATGVKQAVEIFRQIAGRSAHYQIRPAPRVGLSANMGGDDRTAVVTIYRRP
jgi:acetyl-CoA acetyltransferase